MGCRVTPVGPHCLWSKGIPGDSDLGEGRTRRHSMELWGCRGLYCGLAGMEGREDLAHCRGGGGRREVQSIQ